MVRPKELVWSFGSFDAFDFEIKVPCRQEYYFEHRYSTVSEFSKDNTIAFSLSCIERIQVFSVFDRDRSSTYTIKQVGGQETGPSEATQRARLATECRFSIRQSTRKHHVSKVEYTCHRSTAIKEGSHKSGGCKYKFRRGWSCLSNYPWRILTGCFHTL